MLLNLKAHIHIYCTILIFACFVASCLSTKLECNFWGQRRYISCVGPGGQAECTTPLYSQGALTYTGGHTPVGYYAIAPMRINPRIHNSPWYNLYPRKNDNSGWWDYSAFNPETYRSAIGLHRGNATTRGYTCIAVPSNDCWDKIKNVIDSSHDRETITATYHDIIKPVDLEVQAEVIGRLTIHD